MNAPDGRGLPDVVHEILRDNPGQVVHLRLPTDGYPVTACAGGVGQWWTGKGSEVTCPECKELVHA